MQIEHTIHKKLDYGLHNELMVISAGAGLYSEIKATDIVRDALGGTFELPALASPATHIYLFFGSNDKQEYTESVCVEI